MPKRRCRQTFVSLTMDWSWRFDMNNQINFDYANMLSGKLAGRGVSPESLQGFRDRFQKAHADIQRANLAGEIGFFKLPRERDVLRDILPFAEKTGQAFDTVVVLGIGGSALG